MCLDEAALTQMVLPDLKGKFITPKGYLDMDTDKRAVVQDLVQGTLTTNVNKHVKAKVLEVRACV